MKLHILMVKFAIQTAIIYFDWRREWSTPLLLDQGMAPLRIRGRTLLRHFLKSENSFFLTRYYPATGTGICAPGRGNHSTDFVPYMLAVHPDWAYGTRRNANRFQNTWDTGESLMLVAGHSYSLQHGALRKFSQRLKPWSTKVRTMREGKDWWAVFANNL